MYKIGYMLEFLRISHYLLWYNCHMSDNVLSEADNQQGRLVDFIEKDRFFAEKRRRGTPVTDSHSQWPY